MCVCLWANFILTRKNMALCILYIIHITFGYFYIFLSLVIFFASLQDQHLLICLIVGIVLKECLVQLSMNYYRKQNTERKGMFLNVCKKIHVQNNFYFAATSPIKVVSFSHFILLRKTDNFFISSTKIFGNLWRQIIWLKHRLS